MIVTDPVLLSVLSKERIDKDYVEFVQDYAKRGTGKSPYMKRYLDHVSGKNFATFSGLPMVDAYGLKHDLAWYEKRGVFENGNNIFHCIIKGGTVSLVVLSDQPFANKNDSITYHPQLFIGGAEVHPASLRARLLETDPANNSYHNNVLELDYGIFKRILRLREGRFRERWITWADPNGDVKVKHNFTGKLKVRLTGAHDARGTQLKTFIIGDEEIVPASEFKRPDIVYPIEIGASLTVYPDAHVESATVDGAVWQAESGGDTWASLRGAVGNAFNDTEDGMACGFKHYSTTDDTWEYLFRDILLFNTSPLTGAANISATDLIAYGDAKIDDNSASPDMNVYSSASSNDDRLVNGDYDSLGSTPFCDTAITYAAYNVGTPGTANTFAFNLDGIAAIVKDGISKFGFRNVTHDVGGTTPNHVSTAVFSFLRSWTADKGTDHKPKLVVTYTLRVPVADGDLIGIGVIRKS